MRSTVTALFHQEGDAFTLASPRIGRFTATLREGHVVVAGQVIGTLRVLREVFDVVAPSGVFGSIVTLHARQRETPLGYGALIATLAGVDGAPAAVTEASDHALQPGQRMVRAKMDGQLYLRPSPSDPPFVSPGERVSPGDTLATIEVMKFFYPLVYEGEGPARIVDVVARDASPVAPGDPLFVIALED